MSFPKIEITGGPHGKNTELTIDGHRAQGVHRLEAVWDVRDAVRLTVHTYVDAIFRGEAISPEYHVAIRDEKIIDIEGRTVTDDLSVYGKGYTLVEALEDLVAKLKEPQGLTVGGT